MIKRIIAVLLALLMIAGIAAACAKNGPVSTNPLDRTPDPKWVRPTDTPIDLAGRTVTFRGHFATIDQYKRAPTGDPASPTDILYNRIQMVQNKFNFQFNFVSENTSGWRVIVAFHTAALAGSPWADIVWDMSREAFPIQAVKKLVLPLDTVFDFINDPVYNTKFIRSCAEWEGKIYGLAAGPISQPDLGMFYNKDIIDTMGLQDPIALYNQGMWNWDNFFDLAVKATKDLNNDGTVDQWGINGDITRVYQSLVTSNGGDIVDYDEAANTYSLAFEKPAAMRALTKINEIFTSLKIVRPDKFIGTDQDPSFGTGKALFLMAGLPGHIVDMKKNGLANVRWMSLPRGPDNPKGNLNMIRESNYYAWSTSIGTDWEKVVKASSWLFTSWDYNRYPGTDASAYVDKQAWVNSMKTSGTFDDVNVDHIADLMFDQGTVVIKWPAWQEVTDNINTRILPKVFSDMPVADAIEPYRALCEAALKSILAE